MVRTTLTFAAGLAGMVSMSQSPEFSQQYLQRLAGQVDSLTLVIAEFDASAAGAGLTRYEALAELQGTPFLDAHQADKRRLIARHERLSNDLAILRAATPYERMLLPHRMADRDLLEAVWADFRPAVPVTLAGLVAGAVGLLIGWLAMAAVCWICVLPFRGLSRA